MTWLLPNVPLPMPREAIEGAEDRPPPCRPPRPERISSRAA